MTALGRILQVVGWLWVLAGFFGPIAGYQGINIFPGLILVFVARAIRRQAARRAPEEPEESGAVTEERPERILNTERIPPPQPAPEPAIRYQRAEEQTAVDSDERTRSEPDSLIERIVLAGQDQDDDVMEPEPGSSSGQTGEDRARVGMSSAEMLARAHERWNPKP